LPSFALLVNLAKTLFSEAFPELWLFAMGGLFIAVVVAFPRPAPAPAE
jgi:urea transport system permease protein